MSEFSSLPRAIISVRGRNGLSSYLGPVEGAYTTTIQKNNNLRSLEDAGPLRLPPVYSPRGDIICLVVDSATLPIALYNTVNGNLIGTIPCAEAQSISFSPQGRYVVTWSRLVKPTESGEGGGGNLKIWQISSSGGECTVVQSFTHKVFKKDLIQWSDDEHYLFRLVSNEVHIYGGSGEFPSNLLQKLHHDGFTQFKVTSKAPFMIAVFNPESKGNPAKVTLYKYANSLANVEGPITGRTTFSASEATMLWNKQGTVLLTHTHSDVDSSNTSYYGATGLTILSHDGTISAIVPQSKDGPIHDVKWAPSGERFVVAAGNMPSQTTLYNTKAEPIFEFGSAHRNTISWSPHGRFLCIAGFGNLAGEMDFYDMKKMRKIGSNTAHCTVQYSWSPDSRHFLTAILAPRMNVDNGFKIYKYNGVGPVVSHSIEQAYDAMWQPVAEGVYPDRGPSPKKDGDVSTVAKAVEPPKVVAPYRPPGSSGALAAMLKREEAPVGKVKAAPAPAKPEPYKTPVRVIPGLAPAQTAVPPKKKNPPSSAPVVATQPKPQPKKVEVKVETPAPVVAVAPPVSAEEEKEKKIKNIKKKLKQIDEIKAKMTSGGELNKDQKEKLDSEALLLQQLKSLQ